MTIMELMKELAKRGVSTSIHYDNDSDQAAIDLETMAKSSLHLYEDGTLRGRYDYERKIDLERDADLIIDELAIEFNHAMHGRDFGNAGWIALANKEEYCGPWCSLWGYQCNINELYKDCKRKRI